MTTGECELSVIVVNWNGREFLLKCLETVRSCTLGIESECIVVDNGSNDGSAEAVAAKFPEVFLIRNNENRGFAFANNQAIRASMGRFLALINSDIAVVGNCFEELICYLKRNRAAGLVAPKILNLDGTLQPSCRRFPGLWNNFCQSVGLNKLCPKNRLLSEPFMLYFKHDRIAEVDAVRGCFWIVRREVIASVGMLDEAFFFYGEDLDYCWRVWENNWTIAFVPTACAYHAGGASTANAPVRFYVEMQRADLRYWRKHYGRMRMEMYRALILFRQMLRIVWYLARWIIDLDRGRASLNLHRSWACARFVLSGEF